MPQYQETISVDFIKLMWCVFSKVEVTYSFVEMDGVFARDDVGDG